MLVHVCVWWVGRWEVRWGLGRGVLGGVDLLRVWRGE